MHAHEQNPVTKGLLQLCVGLPVYLACTWIALHLIRAATRFARQRPLNVERSPKLATWPTGG